MDLERLFDVASKLVVVATIPRNENIRVLWGLLYLTHLRKRAHPRIRQGM